MSEFHGCVRTNQFSVKDEAKFLSILESCATSDEPIQVSKETVDGQTLFVLGCHGMIYGFNQKHSDKAEALLEFHTALQTVVADGHAIMLVEVGHEDLWYLVGECTVITSTDIRCLDVWHSGLAEAQKMLGNPNYFPQMGV